MYQQRIIGCVAVLLAVSALPCSGQQVAIKGGRVLTMAGPAIDNGVILIRDGRITAVGKDLDIPVDAKVIDASGKVIMPGFVEAHSSAGMSQANEVNPNVPYTSVVDTIDPNRTYFQHARRHGITSAAVVPGNSTMIGGQAAIVKTAGGYVDDMLVKRHAGMKLSLLPASGSNRMSHYAKLRKELATARREAKAADEARAKQDAEKKDAEKKAEEEKAEEKKAEEKKADETQAARGGDSFAEREKKAQRAAMIKLVRGELPVFIYCDNAQDVDQAIKLVKQYELQATLVLGNDCDKAAQQIADAALPVILSPTLVFWRTDPRTDRDEKIVLPKIFRDAGVPVTYQAAGGSSTTLGNNYLWYQAATAVKYGTPREEALKAITLQSAKMLGIDKLVGSIEVGKDADLVILSGDPLRLRTWVEKTLVNGEVVYDRSQDEQLKQLLEPPTN